MKLKEFMEWQVAMFVGGIVGFIAGVLSCTIGR